MVQILIVPEKYAVGVVLILPEDQSIVILGRFFFYTTDDYGRAVKWARHKASIRGKRAAVITLIFDLESAKKDIEVFKDDLRWGRFIINNRNGIIIYINKVSFKENNLDAKYPITYGRIADVDVLNVAKKLFSSFEMLYSIDEIYNSNYSMQYAFHTVESTKYILKMTYKQV